MFDSLSPTELLDVIEQGQRTESMAIAARMSAIAVLLFHRTAEAEGPDDTEPSYALITGYARTCAEVGAALNVSSMAAKEMVNAADALDTRLPRVSALLAEGKTDWRTVALIISRTSLVADEEMRRIDDSMANRITSWQCWSRRRIINAVDAAVRAVDPAAAKERRVNADTERSITITALPNGTAKINGTISAEGGAIIDKRLDQMATSVCKRDTRTIAQRRSDAAVAVHEGRELTCNCGQSDCPAKTTTSVAPPCFVINVIASQETVTGTSDDPGYLEGYGVIDAEQVRQLAETAALRMLAEPAVTDANGLTYQPSAAMERWVRARSLICSFPGCDRPAWIADIDHTIPFNHDLPSAGGQTRSANLDCKCREHHRLKTFHGGLEGWRDEECPDGTIVWTSPTGRVYRVAPAGSDLFPQLRPPCAEPIPRRQNHRKEKIARAALARRSLNARRPINVEQRRVNQARAREIDLRNWRNSMRHTLFVLKGKPSTSPWVRWVNEPREDPNIGADWRPPPAPPPNDDDKPPF